MNDLEVIDAFIDRERVDPEALTRALSSDDGRRYFVDAIALREMTANEGAAPVVTAAARPPRAIQWVGIAAALVLALGGGYALGHQRAAPVVHGAIAQPTLDRQRALPFVPPAPEPTSVIRLRPGVDWNETGG